MEIYIHKMYIELHWRFVYMRVYGSPKIAKMGIHIHGELVTICVYKSPEIRALGDLYT